MHRRRLPKLRLPRIGDLNSDITPSLLVLAAGVGVCLALFHFSISREHGQARSHFRLLAEESISSTVNRIVESSTTVSAIGSYFGAMGQVSRREFAAFVRPFLTKNRSIQALQWVAHVPAQDRARYEADARRDGMAGFHFMEWGPSHRLKIAGARKDYLVVYYNEPLAANRAATGLDNGSEPVRRSVLLGSARHGSETYSPPIRLMQGSAYQKGYLVYLPVYDGSMAAGTPRDRLNHLRGFATGVFVMDRVLRSTLDGRNLRRICLEIVDVTDPRHHQSLGSTGTPRSMAGMSYDRVYSFGNRRWLFRVRPGIDYAIQSPVWVWLRLASSLALVALIFGFLLYRSTAARLLRQSEERWSFALEGSGDGVWDWDASRDLVFYSRQWKGMLGYGDHEIGNMLSERESRIHPDDLEGSLAKLAKHLEGQSPYYESEHRIRCKDGSYKWILDRGKVISRTRDGSPLRVIGTHTDITAHKRVEGELLHREEHFRALIEHSTDAIALVDQNGVFLYASPAVSIINGYEVDEYRGQSSFAVIHPSDRDAIQRTLMELLRSPDAIVPLRCRVVRKDGAWRTVEGIARNLLGVPAVGAIVINYRDITEREEAERALRESETRYRAIFENLQDVYYEVSMDGIVLEMSPSIEVVSRYTREELLGTSIYSIYCDPGSRAQMLEALSETGSVHDVELLVRDKDGSEHQCAVTAAVLMDEMAQPWKICGTLRDITPRKRAEAQARLHSAAINAADDLIAILGIDGRIVFANDSFQRQTGYSEDEITGQELSMLWPHSGERRSEKDVWTAIGLGRAWNGEMPCTTKGGGTYIADVTVTPLPGAGGRTEHLIVIARNVTERKEYEDQLDYQAHHDTLTDLPNRLLFCKELASVVADHGGAHRQCAVLFLDLDNFKLVNDTMGHQAGDMLLVEVASRLQSCTRERDTLARIGGDEFTVLLRDVHSLDDVRNVANRMMEQVSVPFEIAGSRMVIGASIGVSTYPDCAMDADALLSAADAAMYRAKELGRNNCQIFSEEISVANQARVEMERELRLAVELGELQVYYQPIVDVRTSQVVGAEALLRWDHPERGMVSPGLFIPVAEETGLILPMGRMVLETACRQCKIWQGMGHADIGVSVNVSPVQLHKERFSEVVLDILDRTGLSPHSLTLEITETVLARNQHGEWDALNRLDSLGVSICVDDFGTGYSSLSRLKDLPITHMKVDGAFVRDIERNANDRAMTESITMMAHNLGIRVTAEWIEDEQQMATVKSLGCDQAQGHLISPAVRAEDFMEAIQRWLSTLDRIDAA